MAVRDDRSDVKQTTTGFRDPRHHICQKQIPIPETQDTTSAKSKFLSLYDSQWFMNLELSNESG